MKKYDSIPRYGKQGTRDILGTEVVVMEKLDGANASFGIIGGELKIFSRNQELNEYNTLKRYTREWRRKQNEYIQERTTKPTTDTILQVKPTRGKHSSLH